ncbi:MAG: MerR family transcriptional regulator [Acidiferrobacteraceae bacterium]
MQTVTIGALAKQAGVGAGTLRYYERLGLLPPAGRSPSGYRLYHVTDMKRLRFIRRAQELRFSLGEITLLLKLNQERNAQAADVRRLTEEKLSDIAERIYDLKRIQQALQALARQCHRKGPAADCPILAALNEAAPQLQRRHP